MAAALAGRLIRLVHTRSWQEVMEAVETDGGVAAGVDSCGRSLLHYAAWKGAPKSLLTQVLGANADAAAQADNDGRHPLHFATGEKATIEFVRKLIKAAKGVPVPRVLVQAIETS